MKPGNKPAPSRKNTILLWIMLAVTPLYGGYHSAFTLLAGTVLTCALLYTALKNGEFLLPVEPAAWCLYGVWGCMLLTVPFAVSPGMAFTGSLRVAVWILFYLLAAAYSQQERQEILDITAYEGAILAAVTIFDFFSTRLAGGVNLNGRIDGFFQYANTWGLYLLCCLILLLLKRKRKAVDWPAMGLLLCGIFLTGSRGTFLLLFFLAPVYGTAQLVRQRSIRPLLAAAGAVVLAAVLTVPLSGGMVLERLRAISFSSATLNGRILYWLDGLRMLSDHPLGVGQGGYLYIQALEQTGVYTARHIHNEYLQAALDGGILCGIFFAGLAGALLFRRGTPVRERAVCFAVCAHAFIDFDLQFTAVAFLLLLCGGGRLKSFRIFRRTPAVILSGLLAMLFAYLSIAYYMDFIQRPDRAYALYPADLSLAENRLQTYFSAEQAEPLADRILNGTELSMVAWDCKYTAARERNDYSAMVDTKYHYLRLNRYQSAVYEDFADVLEEALGNCSSEELSKYTAYADNVMGQLKEVEETTSPIALRITDHPAGFVSEIRTRLTEILDRKGMMQ